MSKRVFLPQKTPHEIVAHPPLRLPVGRRIGRAARIPAPSEANLILLAQKISSRTCWCNLPSLSPRIYLILSTKTSSELFGIGNLSPRPFVNSSLPATLRSGELPS